MMQGADRFAELKSSTTALSPDPRSSKVDALVIERDKEKIEKERESNRESNRERVRERERERCNIIK